MHSLWLKTFGQKWRIDRRHLSRLFPRKTPCFVALERARVVGFVGTVPAGGSVAAILVEKEHRRQGIGGSLFLAALDSLRRAGCTRAIVGGVPLLWKGIPIEFPSAIRFFIGLGCTPSTKTFDQFRYLPGYEYPAHLDQDLARRDLQLTVAEEEDAERILIFERTHFPHWAEYFSNLLERRQFTRILCVKSDAEILGTTMVDGPGSLFPGAQWLYLAKDGIGGYATLGIAPSCRGQGLGYALSAFATRRVKESGAAVCFINHSEAVPLYRKLGFCDWAEYQACEIAL